jgi:hypothetical protein
VVAGADVRGQRFAPGDPRQPAVVFNDDWWFLFQRPGIESHGGFDTLLAPHNGNMAVLLAVLYRVLTAAFGLGSQVP